MAGDEILRRYPDRPLAARALVDDARAHFDASAASLSSFSFTPEAARAAALAIAEPDARDDVTLAHIRAALGSLKTRAAAPSDL